MLQATEAVHNNRVSKKSCLFEVSLIPQVSHSIVRAWPLDPLLVLYPRSVFPGLHKSPCLLWCLPRHWVQMVFATIPQLGSIALPYLQETPGHMQKQILFSGEDILQEFL